MADEPEETEAERLGREFWERARQMAELLTPDVEQAPEL